MKPLETYSHEFHLPAERRAVFSLFADPGALDQLTPPWFRLLPLGDFPTPLGPGMEISYRLRWRGLPLRWTSRIVAWRRPDCIVYEQVRGPFLAFRHEHFFSSTGDGTEVVDRVIFRAPGGGLPNRWIALPELRRIFAFREQQALRLFQPTDAAGRGARRIPWTRAASSAIDLPM